jgi:NitT/TauT family transport system substrate-binding protein
MSEETRTTLSASTPPHASALEPRTLTRRQLLTLAASASAGLVLAACAPAAAPAATPLPPPETTKIRIACNSCDAPIMAAEAYLKEEGFTDVQLSDAATLVALTDGKVDMGNLFPAAHAAALESGLKVVGLGGIHAGCIEIWAPQSVATLKDLRGRTFYVQAKTIRDVAYGNAVMILKQAGVDPKDVNFVAQSDADVVKLYLEGKNDAVLLAAAAAEGLKANAANKGHTIFVQTMEEPWARMDCCLIVTTQEWYRANPSATKRAMRAILRASDALTADRAAAAKLITDKGLFGGANNVANVRNALNMLSFNWRDLDADKSLRFHGALLAETGLMKISVDELAKSLDLRILNELRTELKKPS